MRKLFACLILLLVWLPSAYVSATCETDPRDCFQGFDPDGGVIPNSGKPAKTFSVPPIKAGFVIDFYHRDLLPHISIEAVAFTVPYAGDFTWDFGVASSRVFTSLVWEVIPIVKIGPSIWAGYNVRENSAAFGIGVSLLDF